jgi:hypothetical protein
MIRSSPGTDFATISFDSAVNGRCAGGSGARGGV